MKKEEEEGRWRQKEKKKMNETKVGGEKKRG